GVKESRELTPLQWQLILKCWKFNLQPGQYVTWMPMAWRIGTLLLWAYKLRRLNGPNAKWPLLMFSGALSEKRLAAMGKIYIGRIDNAKSRRELVAGLRPQYRQHVPD